VTDGATLQADKRTSKIRQLLHDRALVELLKKDIAESQEIAIPRLPHSESISAKRMHEKSDTIDIPVELLETLKSLTGQHSSDN